jgi:polyisoprenyl-phosphate glycosyltransferase
LAKETITVVIPVFNEAEAFAAHFEVILQAVDALRDAEAEVLVVDDGSEDGTVEVVRRFCRTRSDVKLLPLTRNFGKEAAIRAGLDHASGQAVIVMDSDLQHPPELIHRMLALWREGHAVVEAYKKSRGKESALSRSLARSFYALFGSLAGMDLRNHSDFKLLDREVVEAYRALPERGLFFRGLIQWLGFPAARIDFDVQERQGGASAWSRLRLLRFSLGAITSFSAAPLQFVTLFGVLTLLLGLVFGGIALYQKFTGQAVSGFTTVILLILIVGSVLMISLGLIGIYLARIYDEIKHRPRYVVTRSKTP